MRGFSFILFRKGATIRSVQIKAKLTYKKPFSWDLTEVHLSRGIFRQPVPWILGQNQVDTVVEGFLVSLNISLSRVQIMF